MKLNEFLSENKSLIGLIILMAFVSLANANFLGVDNMLNILRQTSINAIIAMGMTFVILTAGIDLSVGSILAFAGAICASLIGLDTPLVIALVATLCVGAALGATSGVIISYFNVQPFIATLVGMTMIRGATLVYTQGRPISTGDYDVAESFYQFGAGYLFGIPHPVIVMAIIFALCWFLLSQTRFGRYVYAIGGNENVARLSGINVKKVKIAVYALSGALAALAGIILTARLESAQPTAGLGYELDAIAAVVLGGTSLAGGKGRIFGTIIGALIIGVLNNALNIMDVSSYYQMIAKGAVILLAVVVDSRGKANA
ncbi:ribose ABC transporter permease [Pseudovibrio sp. Tun.PSC04-5.I4]|uniref:ribose ABC transporter permease n=1 Tax=Pseudovibrio sp. Tun.PSC04-5.I4 TaxID=1798213 RepID=UPI0008876DAC|nr:ribose ABC transporter permease [Pseudovibrio sp. Tun.PSC04-5.I4]SDQ97828.1 ribose ABC transporter membrane protein [Pseudovibrio sp. Tun.PSC04-5.I4]